MNSLKCANLLRPEDKGNGEWHWWRVNEEGKVQEADLRRKHAEYLKEMLPKFNRLRRGDGA